MSKIAIIIPCFNEELTIANVISDCKKYLPQADIYVCDNNSTDNTAKIAKEAGVTVIYETKQGKGNVIRKMFREIDADCYVMIDGDGAHPLNYANDMCSLVLKENVDMVIGDRSVAYFNKNKRPFHNFGNSLVRGSINKLFECDVRDIMTGYRAFSYEFVKTFPVLSKGFEIETEMTIHAVTNNMQIENVVIEYRDRPEGSESKLNTYSDGFKVIRTISRLYRDYKPLHFFSVLAVVLAILAVIFIIPVFIEYWETGLVRRFPTLIVCGFTMIAALQSFFNGLTLQNMAINNRRVFEMQLNGLHRKKMSLITKINDESDID